MKINYTIDNSAKNINIYKSEDNKILISWTDKPNKMSVIELNFDGINKYLQSPSRLISEGNNIYIKLDKEGNLEQPIFKMIETFQTKMGGMEFIKFKSSQILGQIYIPFKYSPADEYAIRLNIKEEDVSKFLELVPNANKVENTEEAFKEFYYANSPRLNVINTSNNGDWTKIKVQLTLAGNNISKNGVRVFAKSSSGYIANREVYTDTNGTAEFKVLPNGLEQGESMKTEFGFKYISNIVSVNVQA